MLKQTGINADRGIERFMGNENFYGKMLKKFPDDSTFEKLVFAASAKDNKAFFEASHTLKGVCGNLSIDVLFELFKEQVILMRAEKWEEAYGMMPEITENYEKVLKVIDSWV